jgi:hypothetical protein
VSPSLRAPTLVAALHDNQVDIDPVGSFKPLLAVSCGKKGKHKGKRYGHRAAR